LRKADRRLEILERRRQTVQRADRPAVAKGLVGLVRQRQAGIVIQLRDDGVQLRIEARDLRQEGAHHFATRHLPRSDLLCEIARTREDHIHLAFLKRYTR
jgi:hypothetical protein